MEIKEIEGFIHCEKCSELIAEEDWERHLEDHAMWEEQEKLSEAEETEITLRAAAASIAAEELRLKEKYGYVIPRSTEVLSSEDIDQQVLKEILIRGAMVNHFKVAQGEEKVSAGKWYLTPKSEFDPKDYEIGKNHFEVGAYSEEYAQELAEKLSNNFTEEKATDLIRGKFDQPKKSKQEIATEEIEALTKKLQKTFKSLWEDPLKSHAGVSTRIQLNEKILLKLGAEMFKYGRCPLYPNCDFRAPRNLSKKKKAMILMKHLIEDHLSKVKGRSELAVIKEVVGKLLPTEPDEPVVPEAPIAKTPNPESCSMESLSAQVPKDQQPTTAQARKLFEQTDDIKAPKGDKALARIFGEVTPTTEELEDLVQLYYPYYYVQKGKFVCKKCGATFKNFRRFLIHFREAHRDEYKKPSYYKKYYPKK